MQHIHPVHNSLDRIKLNVKTKITLIIDSNHKIVQKNSTNVEYSAI